MKFEENLTNEVLTKRFANQFELVRYAITRVRNAIVSGREPQVRSETQNLSAKVLMEIGLGVDQYDDFEDEEEEEEEIIVVKEKAINFDDEDEDDDDAELMEEETEVETTKTRKPKS